MGRINTRGSQSSILRPVLLNIYLNDLFYFSESKEVCNFADDTTFYAGDKDLNSLIKRLEHDIQPYKTKSRKVLSFSFWT